MNYRKLEIKIKKKLNSDFLGSFNSAFKWLWVEFDSLREYVLWDNTKSIDWKTTAKKWELFVKNYEEEKDLKILFIFDKNDNLNFWSEKQSKKEVLSEIFFLLAYSWISLWHSIWTLINGNFIDFKKNEENIIKTFKYLENNKIKKLSWETNNKIIKNLNIKNTLIFYITDNLEPNLSELKYLNVSNEIIYINNFDFFENNLSDDDFSINLIWTNFISLLLWKNNKTKVDNYRQFRKDKINNLSLTLRKQRIWYLKIDNRDDIFLNFYKLFS